MLEILSHKVPAYLRKTYLRLGFDKLDRAVAMQQGCRFFEELQLDALLEERRQIQQLNPDLDAAK